MHVQKPIVVLAGLSLLAVVRPADAGPTTSPDRAVAKQPVQLAGKFDFVEYFKERGLNTPCAGESVVNDTIFMVSMENNNFSPCLCTVIHNTTRQLKELSSLSSPPGSSLDPPDVRIAMSKSIEFNDSVAYETWKNASRLSPSMKLLMGFLNNIDRWNSVCYNNRNKAVTSYCKFLNVNVWLLTACAPQTPKESLGEHNVGAPSVKVQAIPSDKPDVKTEVKLEEPKKSFNLLQPPDDIQNHDNESNIKTANDVQKPKDESIFNDNEPAAEPDSTKEVDEELSQDPEENIPIQSETDTNDFNLKGFDSTITHTKTKETQLMYSQTTMTKKHGFSETDDSHFLFYFSAMTILSMLFYLALYNKKKIIALLIEGRRGTNHRRRLNTATYSKVETDDGSTVF